MTVLAWENFSFSVRPQAAFYLLDIEECIRSKAVRTQIKQANSPEEQLQLIPELESVQTGMKDSILSLKLHDNRA